MSLLDEKATVPFIARYRKEATGGLDDTQLRTLEERLTYLREMEERRAAILKSIDEQGKLTPELTASIDEADTKARLEDLYLPYKPKRRTKAQIAREAGLEPLALALLGDRTLVPEEAAAAVRRRREGRRRCRRRARRRALDPDGELRGGCRAASAACASTSGSTASGRLSVIDGKQEEGIKFSDYFSASETVKSIPSHRILALLRGRNEGFLRCQRDAAGERRPMRIRATVRAGAPDCRQGGHRTAVGGAAPGASGGSRRKAVSPRTAGWPKRAVDVAHQDDGVDVARSRTAAARAGRGRSDPRLRAQPARSAARRAGGTARHDGPRSRHPHRRQGRGRRRHRQAARHGGHLSARAAQRLGRLAANARRACRKKHDVQLISIGNGTASRETDKLAGDLIAQQRRAAPDQGDGVGSGRVGLLGVGASPPAEFPGSRCDAARRGLDRAAPAGSARRAGAHRPEVDRRRPVSARRQPGPAREEARRGRRRLRERSGRRRQHRLGAAARAHLRTVRSAREEHRRLSRRARSVREPRASC